MENLLKVISKDYLVKLNIVASEEDDNEQPTDAELKEIREVKNPNIDVELDETLEEAEQQKEIRKKIRENNSGDGTPEEDIDEEDFKSETTKNKEKEQVIKNWENPYSSDYKLQPGEMDRWHLTQLKKLKERILKRLSQTEDTNEETEEGDTNE